jgi:hypothetical protein
MDSIRVSEAPDSGSIPDEATIFSKIADFTASYLVIPYLSNRRLAILLI